MASIPTPTAAAAGATTNTCSSSFTTTSPAVSSCPLFSKTTKKCSPNSLIKQTHVHKISCNKNPKPILKNLDRRNILLLLGGLAGAINLTSVPSVGAINGGGSVEHIPHNPAHRWVGDPREPNGLNLRKFYSAGRDPDWLNTSFVFYDENKNPVQVNFPVKLDKTVKVLVPRPKKSRSGKEKEEEEEILVFEGISYDSEKYVKFDVFVNDEDGTSAPDQTEYAGSFARLPYKTKGTTRGRTSFQVGLTELLEELEADDDDHVLVTVLPRSAAEDVTIDDIKIIYR